MSYSRVGSGFAPTVENAMVMAIRELPAFHKLSTSVVAPMMPGTYRAVGKASAAARQRVDRDYISYVPALGREWRCVVWLVDMFLSSLKSWLIMCFCTINDGNISP